MLRVLLDEDLVDRPFIGLHTSGFEGAAGVAAEWTPRRAARVCGVEAEDIVRAARRFGEAKASLVMWTLGDDQRTLGRLKNRAIINLCLSTGNVGKVGAGPFSLSGQPNGMGDRETGGFAHLLPGYRRIDDPVHRTEVEEAWGITRGFVPERSASRRRSSSGRWTPARSSSCGSRGQIRPSPCGPGRGLGNAFVISQDVHPTETTRLADLVLPAAGWGERSATMTNSERRVSIVEKLVEPPGEARADWEIFAGVARKMGFGESFGWTDSAAVYDEFVGLTRGTPVDVSGLSHERLRDRPVQWPAPERIEYAEQALRGIVSMWDRSEAEHPGTPRLYADKKFNTPDRRARFRPTPIEDLDEASSGEYPLVLCTEPVEYQQRSATRLEDRPLVGLHPEVAGEEGIRDGQLVRVVSASGDLVARAVVTEDVEPGKAFVSFHQEVSWIGNDADPVYEWPNLDGAAARVEPLSDEDWK